MGRRLASTRTVGRSLLIVAAIHGDYVHYVADEGIVVNALAGRSGFQILARAVSTWACSERWKGSGACFPSIGGEEEEQIKARRLIVQAPSMTPQTMPTHGACRRVWPAGGRGKGASFWRLVPICAFSLGVWRTGVGSPVCSAISV